METPEEFLKETDPVLLKDLGSGTVKPRVLQSMGKYADLYADACMNIYRRPFEELKTLESIWREENLKDNHVLPDLTIFLKWIVKKIEYANQSKWISVETELPEDGEEVIGFSEKWIHPDFNIEGTRVCFINMGEWISAKWNNDQDSWHTHADWCCGDNGGQDFNPTHWQHKPKRP